MSNLNLEPIQTLPQMIESAARFAPNKGIAIFDRRGQKFERRTFPELLESAKAYAARLLSLNIQPGDCLLISLPTSWELLQIYFGAILCGAYPTLISHTGSFGGGDAFSERVTAVAELLNARAIFCDLSTRNELIRYSQHDVVRRIILPEELNKLQSSSRRANYNPLPAELAFIQLSSGSTGPQRAIKISHNAACHNARAIGNALNCRAYTGADTGVSWLPLNHDMGLVGCLFFSIMHGFDLWLMKPETFLARPRQWLQTLSDCKATLTAAPNFAYQTCVERISTNELTGIDLSSMRALMTGAEIIRPETCSAFQKAFANAGLRANVFVPCYGLAETTLAVTFGASNQGIRTAPLPNGPEISGGSESVVSSGAAISDTAIRICSPLPPHTVLPDGSVGEICVNSPSLFSGYYGEADTISGQEWFHTGDLGFLNHGELYLTGRLKDILIIRGRNIMPHEIEWLAERELGEDGSERTCAFSIDAGSAGEQAILIIEVPQRLFNEMATLERLISEKISSALGFIIADLVFVKRGQIPKTSSGKVKRHEMRRCYLEGHIERFNAPRKQQNKGSS